MTRTRTTLEAAPGQSPAARRPLAPEEAARIWRELATGLWRVLAAVDHDGARHLVIGRAASQRPVEWERLGFRERRILDLASGGMSQKVIAIEIGRSRSSVCETLRRTRLLLRFASFAELVRAYRARRASAPESRRAVLDSTGDGR
jgi:DNA-binding CsgD family transcriptional regulator